MPTIFCCPAVIPLIEVRSTHTRIIHTFVATLMELLYVPKPSSLPAHMYDHVCASKHIFQLRVLHEGGRIGERYFIPDLFIEHAYAEISREMFVETEFKNTWAYNKYVCEQRGHRDWVFVVSLWELPDRRKEKGEMKVKRKTWRDWERLEREIDRYFEGIDGKGD